MRPWHALLLLALLWGAPGCADNPAGPEAGDTADDRAQTRADLTAQRQRWVVYGPRNYRYRYRKSCFCAPSATAPVLVTVRGVEVTEVVDAESGVPVDPARLRDYPSIDEIFARLQQAIDAEAYEVRATYDLPLGYPTSVYVDQDPHIADEEVRLEASSLEAIP